MLKVWGRSNSNNVKKVLWCLDEVGEAYERIEAGGAFGVVDTPSFRAMNPNGTVPVLEDDGFVLWESNAIVRHLAATRAGGRLVPADPRVRASADRWMDWCSIQLAPALIPVFVALVRTPPEKRDPAAIEAGTAKCAGLLAMADAALADDPYLSGEAFGFGDIPLGCWAWVWFQLPVTRPDLPNLAAWHARLMERDAYRSVVATPLT